MPEKIHRKSLNVAMGAYDLYKDDSSRVQTLLTSRCSGNAWNLPIFCQNMMETIRYGYRWYKHVRYPHIALELVLDGKMKYHSNHDVQIAESGMLYIISPGSNVSFSTFEDIPMHHLVALIDGRNLGSIAATLRMDEDHLIKVEDPGHLEEMFRKLGKVMEDETSWYQNSMLTYGLLLEISRQIPEADDHFKKARQIMEEQYFKNISIEEISALCHMSSSSFWRMFKKESGLSPMEYLMDIRMKKAVKQLQRTRLPVRRIAQNCGFADASRFCSLFKKKYGCTPDGFRNGKNQPPSETAKQIRH